MDSSPVALFDSYDQDFQQIIQSIRDKLDGEANDQRAGELSILHCTHVLSATGVLFQSRGKLLLEGLKWN